MLLLLLLLPPTPGVTSCQNACLYCASLPRPPSSHHHQQQLEVSTRAVPRGSHLQCGPGVANERHMRTLLSVDCALWFRVESDHARASALWLFRVGGGAWRSLEDECGSCGLRAAGGERRERTFPVVRLQRRVTKALMGWVSDGRVLQQQCSTHHHTRRGTVAGRVARVIGRRPSVLAKAVGRHAGHHEGAKMAPTRLSAACVSRHWSNGWKAADLNFSRSLAEVS